MENSTLQSEKNTLSSIFSKQALFQALRISTIVLLVSLSLNITDFLFFSHKLSLDPFFNFTLLASGTLIIIGSTIALFEAPNVEKKRKTKKSELQETLDLYFPIKEKKHVFFISQKPTTRITKEKTVFQGKLFILAGFILFFFIVVVDAVTYVEGYYYILILTSLTFKFSMTDFQEDYGLLKDFPLTIE